MITSLTKIISNFPGAANRARCTAHIVNLVSKIILKQFDARKKTKRTKKKSENANDKPENANDKVDNANEPDNGTEEDNEDELTSLADDLDREEQEVVDDEDDGMSESLAADLEEIEEAMKEEIVEVAKKVKPVQRVLYKVRSFIILLTLTLLMYVSAPEARLCHKKVNNDTPPTMERNLRRTGSCCRRRRQKTIVSSYNASGCVNALEFDV